MKYKRERQILAMKSLKDMAIQPGLLGTSQRGPINMEFTKDSVMEKTDYKGRMHNELNIGKFKGKNFFTNDVSNHHYKNSSSEANRNIFNYNRKT